MMRFSNVFLGIFLSAGLCFSASANSEGDLRQKLFEMDKAAALAGFSSKQERACVKAFTKRYGSSYTLSGALSFNERLSKSAYDQLFWEGKGNLHRGLIFTGSVTDSSGAKAGNLICYYATTDSRLDFQNAYVLPVQKEMTIASNEGGNR